MKEQLKKVRAAVPWQSDRAVLIAVLIGIVIFMTLDMISDLNEGATWKHVGAEAVVVCACLAALVSFGWKAYRLQRELTTQNTLLAQAADKAARAEEDFVKAEAETQRWKSEVSSLLSGLSHAIDDQFERWKMTSAEKEVGLLLLKGLSLKDIADIRKVSEKTVRTQSLAIYSKSGLAGRAELSAFFLEDLLLPPSRPGLQRASSRKESAEKDIQETSTLSS